MLNMFESKPLQNEKVKWISLHCTETLAIYEAHLNYKIDILQQTVISAVQAWDQMDGEVASFGNTLKQLYLFQGHSCPDALHS